MTTLLKGENATVSMGGHTMATVINGENVMATMLKGEYATVS